MENSKELNVENAKAQMRKGILEFCILLVIARGRAYASEILAVLKDADLIVVEGTIYPILTRLKNAELLEYAWEESASGPPRKYYALTEKGSLFLAELAGTWGELDKSVDRLIEKYK